MIQQVEVECVNSGTKRYYPLGITLQEILNEQKANLGDSICGALVNNKVKELSFTIVKSKKIEFIDYSHPDGIRLYVRSLLFVLYVAVSKVFPQSKLKIMHSISKGYYCEIEELGKPISESDVFMIKNEMQQIIRKDVPFIKKGIPTNEAVEICLQQNLEDKAKLLEQQGMLFTYLYFLEDYANYFYGHLLPSTGYIKNFDLISCYEGILLRIPKPDNFKELRDFVEQHKLFDIFQEHKDWAEILKISTLGNLNEFTLKGESGDIIKISEALHEKKVVEIANMIFDEKDKVKVVLISGPSASGKTTFSKRLMVQLAVNGLKPTTISLDDYFVDREKTPRDEHGEFDFESINAIDIEFFNDQLLQLFNGKEIELPRFNFMLGKRTKSGNKLKLGKNSILIVEGIHGMNPNLIPHIKKENTFKIFLSALTQISFDEHNHISTTDNRLIRRIIRDSKYRGYSASETLKRWGSVRKGEDKNIFPYQENADIMFNSALTYEIAVLKRYAEPLLKSVQEYQDEFSESNRLLKFLSYFITIEETEIPPTSLIREFLGGSSFSY